ncbi:MAG: hypothetical protein QW590_00775 [Candidatus Bilamarchaeaceae archaeon]
MKDKFSIPVIMLSLCLLLLGCITLGGVEKPIETQPETIPQQCRVVTEQIPYLEEVCREEMHGREECEYKELSFVVSQVEEIDLCMEGDSCSGKPLGECISRCTKAMKRCKMNITNLDTRHSGVWSVGATFTQGKNSFIKNPESAEILPGRTHTFDFTQIYSLGIPSTSATCSLYVLTNASVRDCKTVSRPVTVCENVTKVREEQRVVCG